MNLYRVLRLGPLNQLPAGTVLEAIVVAPDEGWARGVAAVEENDQAIAHHWLDTQRTACYLVGVAADEYFDDQVDGDGIRPQTVVVSRQPLDPAHTCV